MNKILQSFRKFKSRLRVNLIRKLGGFSIMPSSGDHIIVKSTTVTPKEYACNVQFSQDDIYDISPEDLEHSAKKKLREKLTLQILNSDMIDFSSEQDTETGTIEMRACVWLVDPKAMNKANKTR